MDADCFTGGTPLLPCLLHILCQRLDEVMIPLQGGKPQLTFEPHRFGGCLSILPPQSKAFFALVQHAIITPK